MEDTTEAQRESSSVVIPHSGETRRPTRLLLVDDHPLLAEGLAVALRQEGFEIEIADASNSVAILDAAVIFQPDIVLLDLMLGDVGSGLDLIAPLATACDARVLMLTGVTDRVVLAACLEAGAVGLASKSQPFPRLLDHVIRVAEGGSPLSAQERLTLLDELRRHRSHERERLAAFESLTRREQQVLAALIDGKSPQEIATESYVEEGTVRSQLKAIYRKLGVNSQLGAVAAARRAAWSPDSFAAKG